MCVCIYISCILICIIIYLHIYEMCGTVQFLQGKKLDGEKKAGWKDSMFRNNLYFYFFIFNLFNYIYYTFCYV